MRFRYLSMSRAWCCGVPSVVAVLVSVACAGVLGGGLAEAQAPCSNEQLRGEQPYGLRLPDCRAYELVSPPNDNGISYFGSRASVSVESPAIAYLSGGAFSEPKSASLEDRYIARRGPDGWSTQNISPPYVSLGSNIFPPFKELLFTPVLSKGLVESEGTPLGERAEPTGYVNLYVAGISNETYQLVTTAHSLNVGPYLFEDDRPLPAGVSTDLSHVVFQEGGNLIGGVSAEDETDHVYEWADGVLRFVDVPPEGGQKFEASDGVGAFGFAWEPEFSDEWHAVSADGSRVFFTAGEGKVPKESPQGRAKESQGQVYVRENPMSAVEDCSVAGDACTAEVSASQREPLDPNDHTTTARGEGKLRPARYWGATADGSRVFFTSRAELTNDADTGPADNAENLYEYDVEDGELVDLTPENAEGAGVLGLVTASEDGSYVYFVAEGKLTTQANAKEEEPESGKPNLYLSDGGRTTFIATLAPATSITTEGYEEGGDASDWDGTQLEQDEHNPDKNFGPEQHTVRVASGGNLAFESEQRLTGYDNERAEAGECEPSGMCREVFLYDAATGRLGCVSCPRGCAESCARPVGPADIDFGSGAFYDAHNLSEDGGRLFFESLDALVPQDSNGLLDVYEWEAEGEGSCGEGGGCVYPSSDVAGGYESRFMDATPSGDDVFIATKDQLVPAADGNSRVNLYDARVDGGFPVSEAPPACANADSCKPPVSPQPSILGAPASATFSGAGNLAPLPVGPPVKPRSKPKRCKRGFKRRRGKCVKAGARKADHGSPKKSGRK